MFNSFLHVQWWIHSLENSQRCSSESYYMSIWWMWHSAFTLRIPNSNPLNILYIDKNIITVYSYKQVSKEGESGLKRAASWANGPMRKGEWQRWLKGATAKAQDPTRRGEWWQLWHSIVLLSLNILYLQILMSQPSGTGQSFVMVGYSWRGTLYIASHAIIFQITRIPNIPLTI